MSHLSSAFNSAEDQIEVFNSIKGFTGKTQTEIIKLSGGDVSKVPELVERAMKGEFNMTMCHYGFCDFMSERLKGKVSQLLNEGKNLDELLKWV